MVDFIFRALPWFLTILVVSVFLLLAGNLATYSSEESGNRAVEAAVLTLGAEQTEIERSGEYLGSTGELEASEPELGQYFIEGGLDRTEVQEDGRTLEVEYSSDGGTIRMVFLDGNLVNVTCREIESCPSAAELYQRSEAPAYS